MNFEFLLLLIFLIYAACSFAWGIKNRRRPYGLSTFFIPIGAFVWVDTIVFGIFFAFVILFCLIFNQWMLFWLTFSAFWLIRSIGETIYWFLEQYASSHKNPPHTLWPYKWFKGDEIWIVMQIYCQCISVISLIATIYFAHMWLKGL